MGARVVATLVVVVIGLAGTGCSSSTRRPTAVTCTPSSPGARPQTPALPTDTDPAFESRARLLWRAVVADQPGLARPAFFPICAYRQVKAVTDPDRDWNHRLWRSFVHQVHQFHLALGAGARRSRFVALDVAAADHEWIVPGRQKNKVGYWQALHARLRCAVGGAGRSLPITTLISWRGEWYVVHLQPLASTSPPVTQPGVSYTS